MSIATQTWELVIAALGTLPGYEVSAAEMALDKASPDQLADWSQGIEMSQGYSAHALQPFVLILLAYLIERDGDATGQTLNARLRLDNQLHRGRVKPASLSVTAKQLVILRHALGLKDNGTGQAYRNHFVTGPGSKDFEDCSALVSSGLMSVTSGSELTGGNALFTVTTAGRAKAVAP